VQYLYDVNILDLLEYNSGKRVYLWLYAVLHVYVK